jgi:hypothetical protein
MAAGSADRCETMLEALCYQVLLSAQVPLAQALQPAMSVALDHG